MQAAADRDEVTKSAITEIEQQAAKSAAEGIPRTRWLVFSTGVEHAKHIADEFAARGYDVRCVTDDTSDEDRDAAVEWYKARGNDLRVLVNNRIFTTGFDVPEVDLIGVLLATNSTSLWVQLLGRGMRVAPWAGKVNCLVLDFGGNIRRLGPVNDPILPRKKGTKSGQGAPVRLCEACGTYNHASARFCVSCQAEFPVAVKFGDTASEAEVMARDTGTEPIIEVHEVTQVTYSRHHSKREGVPDSLRVTYNSNHRAWSKFVCLEHEGHAGHLARKWWRLRCHYEPPTSVTAALEMQGELVPPTHIRVWENRKPYPQVMAEDFTGTAFGGQAAAEIQEEIPF